MNMLGKVVGDDRQCFQFVFLRADIYSWFEGILEIKYLQFSKKVEMVGNQFCGNALIEVSVNLVRFFYRKLSKMQKID